MKKLLIILLAAALLCGCGAAEPEPTPSPEPTPEPTPAPTEYVLGAESAEEILALAEISSLKYIDATASREYEAIIELYRLMPECEIVWEYEFQGQSYPHDTKELKVTDLEGLEDAIKYLPELESIDLLESPAVLEDLDRYYELNPNIFFLWEFEHDGFRLRTDIEVYSSLRGRNYPRFTDEDVYPLVKYCKKLKALDLGHCALEDISYIGELSELEVLILADNPYITDASPLSKLNKLEYLELFLCDGIVDDSFLDSMESMQYLNVCYNPLADLDFLEKMPDIKLFMLKYTGIEQSEVDEWQQVYPETEFIRNNGDIYSCDHVWRGTKVNYYVRYAFSGWRHVLDYRHYDDVDYDFDIDVYDYY